MKLRFISALFVSFAAMGYWNGQVGLSQVRSAGTPGSPSVQPPAGQVPANGVLTPPNSPTPNATSQNGNVAPNGGTPPAGGALTPPSPGNPPVGGNLAPPASGTPTPQVNPGTPNKDYFQPYGTSGFYQRGNNNNYRRGTDGFYAPNGQFYPDQNDIYLQGPDGFYRRQNRTGTDGISPSGVSGAGTNGVNGGTHNRLVPGSSITIRPGQQ